MKMFSKQECEYKGGYIVHGDEIVAVDNEIVDLINKLEEDVQRASFNSSSMVLNYAKEIVDHHNESQFVRQSERGAIYPVASVETPELDKLADKAIRIMDEFDEMDKAVEINNYFQSIIPLVLFANDEFIVSSEQGTQHRFDVPTIGNPLKLSKDKLIKIVFNMFGVDSFSSPDVPVSDSDSE